MSLGLGRGSWCLFVSLRHLKPPNPMEEVEATERHFTGLLPPTPRPLTVLPGSPLSAGQVPGPR